MLTSRGRTKWGRSSLPPEIQCTPVLRRTFGFQVNVNAAATNVSGIDISGALGGICTIVNSKFQPWASTFRIREIRIWPSPSTSGFQQAVVSWALALSNQVKDDEKFQALPEGCTETRMMVSRPPRGAIASMWQAPTASSIFLLSISAGAIVHFDVEYTLSNQITAGNMTIVSGVLGQIYYLALDGPTTNIVRPIGLPTTA